MKPFIHDDFLLETETARDHPPEYPLHPHKR